jgi:hypothetical protein
MNTGKIKTATLCTALLGSALILGGAARASITGSLWENQPGSVPASAPGTAPDVTFSVPNGSLGFSSIVDTFGNKVYNDGPGFNYGANYTISSFLATGGATILTGAGEGGHTINNTLIELIGQVTLTHGQQFTVTHDDGLTFKVGGNYLVNVPNPTAPVTTTVTFNGASGTYDFDLLYGEVGGPGAVLQLDLPLTPVPEPTTVVAGALLLLPFGASVLRKMRRNRAA